MTEQISARDEEHRPDGAISVLRLQLQGEIAAERAAYQDKLALAYADRLELEHSLAALRRQVVYLEEALNRAHSELQQIQASRAVRMLKLARASRAVLRRQGPFALARYVALWMAGKRGFDPNDLPQAEAQASMLSGGQDYHKWFIEQRTAAQQLDAQRRRSIYFPHRPLMSLIVASDNLEPDLLRDTIEAVLAQTYDNWELCFVGGASTNPGVHEVLRRYPEKDSRIRITILNENKELSGTSSAAIKNAAIERAEGEFVLLQGTGDLIEPDLLYRVVEAINTAPDTDVVYFDEDCVSRAGDHFEQPLFKPGWSPETLLSTPYPRHGVIRRQLVVEAGGFDSSMDGALDWDLFLRLSERTSKFVRIPRMLYHACGSAAPAVNPQARDTQLAAVQRHLERRGFTGAKACWAMPGTIRVTWKTEQPLVSIIIPTKDNAHVLRRCLDSIAKRTAYENYEIILVDTGSVEKATTKYYATLARGKPVKIVQYEGAFNYSRACNLGARHAAGQSLLFMNNDMEVLTADWLEELVRWSQVPEIGVVGAKLLYPDKTIQHAGVIIGRQGVATHIFYGCPEHEDTLFGSMDWYRNYLAVTGALQIMRREVYDAVQGYDERYHISYSDVALCLQARALGYRVLYDPFVPITHYESQSRDRAPSSHDSSLALPEFRRFTEYGDPYRNENLSYAHALPRLERPSEMGW